MRALVEVNQNKINIELDDLAKLIWGIDKNGLWINHAGTTQTLKDEFRLSFSLFPSNLNPEWQNVPLEWKADGLLIQPVKENSKKVAVFTEFETELPFNQKGFYNLVAYLATHLNGEISEDDGNHWETVAQFRAKHKSIMTADFDQLLSESIKIGPSISPVDEPKYYDLLNE
ncbi:hypothetical protein EFP00_15165 [Lactiplantibacillus paraplantarum]|uniref:hypothetical protein n=1 Tax=Lactiplantibacillus paraplantarum TaxID=60520 RepID=UPI0021A5C435|nr:hypothetical protein [Lactiplantibacillus paraplantarum]MCT4458706.1 hypothetical protein [Lactiplantibacillus paraplantarum]